MPVERISSLRSRILAEHSALVRRLDIDSDIPAAETLGKQAVSVLSQIPERLEARLLDHVREHDRRRSVFAGAALWLVLLWFPFLQPVLTGVLEIFAEGGTLQIARGAYRIVSALSAPHLLAGFAVVAGVYVGVLAVMYSRCLRAVHGVFDEHGTTSLAEQAVDEVLTCEVLGPLVRPFQEKLDRLTDLLARAESEESEPKESGQP